MADDIRMGENRFRTGFSYKPGLVPAQVLQCKILNINLVNWTVDVVSQFDRYVLTDIQVGSPYLHYNNGEGLSIFPEVGAQCMVCIPSDSSPPFVLSFVMPLETVDIDDVEDQTAGGGTGSRDSLNKSKSAASFAGGRPKPKPGDIWLRTRDDNFVILHRGGTLQIGASELSQRICVPLNHFMMDISQNYAHHNSGGSVVWGLQEGPATNDIPSEYTQTFRVFANSKFADVRLKSGKVTSPLIETGDTSMADHMAALKVGSDIWVYELDISRDGFNPETGVPEANASKNMSFRFVVDRAGGTMLKAVGGLLLASQKKLRLVGREGVEIRAGTSSSSISMDNAGMTLDGGALAHIKAGLVRLGPGGKPVATQGSLVQITLPFTPVPASPTPLVLYGIILTGTPTVLA
jgi:hypothetical protein